MNLLKCLFLVSSLAACAFAQDPQPATVAATKAPVHLNVVVTPRSGQPVIADLSQSAFTLLDNGRPQPIQSFRAVQGKDAPVKVFLVIDAVNIPYVQLSYERGQIDNFLHSHDGKLSHPTAVAVFTDTSTKSTGFTTDGNQLARTLASQQIGLRELRRSAGFYGAAERFELSQTALQTFLNTTRTIPGRKVILWVSPGWPILSGPRVEYSSQQERYLFRQIVALSGALRENNTTLYAVDPLGTDESPGRTFYYEEFLKGIRRPTDALPGDISLQVLAVQSGGLALAGSNDVAGLLQRCMDDVNAFYEISFDPPPADAPEEYHKIDVRLAAPNLTARTRQGYYSQP